jgi:diaminopimelate decarboxylase
LSSIAPARGPALPIALRLAPAGRRESRFGLGVSELLAVVERRWPAGPEVPAGSDGTLRIEGVHFHLDGYDPAERVAALGESFALVDALRARGHEPRFVDFGGGIPITYLDDRGEWERFWEEHAAALLGERPPLTFDGHGLGLSAHAGEIIGRPNVYPFHQDPTRAGWLAEVLGATLNPPTGRHGTVAAVARESGLELRCEPGRALMDGCGLTAARVEFRKRRRDGTSLIGLAMNRTQCRSTSDDFLVDPLLLRPTPADGSAPAHGGPAVEGFLVGAYCIERELLIWRRLRFPEGVEVGDVVVFPNTAGYLMHILESASHQIPLARNLVLRSPAGSLLDPIDAVSR